MFMPTAVRGCAARNRCAFALFRVLKSANRAWLISAVAIGAALELALPAGAALVNAGGTMFQLLPPPTNVSQNVLESDVAIFAFPELAAVLLGHDLVVDASLPGHYDELADLTGGVIPAGTAVNSYLLHQDNDPDVPGSPLRTGSVTFQEQILGVLIGDQWLQNTDGLLGLPTTTYGPGPHRGLELWALDEFTLSEDLHTLTLTQVTHSFQDQVRIVTAVPEPTTLALLVGGGLMTAFRRRR